MEMLLRSRILRRRKNRIARLIMCRNATKMAPSARLNKLRINIDLYIQMRTLTYSGPQISNTRTSSAYAGFAIRTLQHLTICAGDLKSKIRYNDLVERVYISFEVSRNEARSGRGMRVMMRSWRISSGSWNNIGRSLRNIDRGGVMVQYNVQWTCQKWRKDSVVVGECRITDDNSHTTCAQNGNRMVTGPQYLLSTKVQPTFFLVM